MVVKVVLKVVVKAGPDAEVDSPVPDNSLDDPAVNS